jgi:hypothetical protein
MIFGALKGAFAAIMGALGRVFAGKTQFLHPMRGLAGMRLIHLYWSMPETGLIQRKLESIYFAGILNSRFPPGMTARKARAKAGTRHGRQSSRLPTFHLSRFCGDPEQQIPSRNDSKKNKSKKLELGMGD